EYGDAIERHACDRVEAVATEAVRKAVNQDAFVQQADAILGRFAAQLEVIDGEREARLSWRAVAESFPELGGARRVLGVGGGYGGRYRRWLDGASGRREGGRGGGVAADRIGATDRAVDCGGSTDGGGAEARGGGRGRGAGGSAVAERRAGGDRRNGDDVGG